MKDSNTTDHCSHLRVHHSARFKKDKQGYFTIRPSARWAVPKSDIDTYVHKYLMKSAIPSYYSIRLRCRSGNLGLKSCFFAVFFSDNSSFRCIPSEYFLLRGLLLVENLADILWLIQSGIAICGFRSLKLNTGMFFGAFCKFSESSFVSETAFVVCCFHKGRSKSFQLMYKPQTFIWSPYFGTLLTILKDVSNLGKLFCMYRNQFNADIKSADFFFMTEVICASLMPCAHRSRADWGHRQVWLCGPDCTGAVL